MLGDLGLNCLSMHSIVLDKCFFVFVFQPKSIDIFRISPPKRTVFTLITAHTPISAQSINSVVFRLKPLYFFPTSLYRQHICGYPFELQGLCGTH